MVRLESLHSKRLITSKSHWGSDTTVTVELNALKLSEEWPHKVDLTTSLNFSDYRKMVRDALQTNFKADSL